MCPERLGLPKARLEFDAAAPSSQHGLPMGRRILRKSRRIVLGVAFGFFASSCRPPPDPTGPRQSATAHASESAPEELPIREARRKKPATAPAPEPQPILSEEALSARLAAQQVLLGERSLFEDVRGQPVPWIDPQPEEMDPVFDDLLLALPGSSGLGGSTDVTGTPRVNGNALGLFEPLEGSGLEPFYTALRNLKAGQDEDGKVRILSYGASHTDADIYPHYVRAYLQERFGDGGHGFVHIAKPWRWYGHVDLEIEGFKYWKTEHAQSESSRNDGYYGLLGASLSARDRRASGRVTHRNGTVGSRYEVSFLKQPKGGSFRIAVDDRTIATVKTRSRELGPGYYAFEIKEGSHSIALQAVGDGEIRMFGMTIEREQPGVVVDTLGIGGSRATNMLGWNEAVWADSVRRRDPALITLAYGTNEAGDSGSMANYEAGLREVLARLRRAAPRAACLLIGPGDFPLPLDDGRYGPRPRVSEIVITQERIAREAGCAFWDLRAFMGGELSMIQWVHANPQMAKEDHIHFTRRGYVRMGMALVDAMMQDFDGPDLWTNHRFAPDRSVHAAMSSSLATERP